MLDKTYAATNAEVHETSNAEIMFFLRFGHDFGGPGASQRQLRRQCQTRHQKISGLSPFWEVILEHFGSQICLFVYCVCDNFYAYFWHRFWEASTSILEDLGGHFRVPFGVILNIYSQVLQNSKNATLSSETLGLGGVEPPFLHLFCLLFECVFSIAF